MKKIQAVAVGLGLSLLSVTTFAAPKCVMHSANKPFGIWDSTCSINQYVNPVVYRPDFNSDWHLMPVGDTGGGCGGFNYLRDRDDHGNQLYTDQITGVLLATKDEHFPSGFPVGTVRVNIETQNDFGETQACDFTFTRKNNAVEICSDESNPTYCDVQSGNVLIAFGGMKANGFSEKVMHHGKVVYQMKNDRREVK